MTDTSSHPTRRRATTRARLLEAAAGVFAEKGLQGATVDDLAGAAGYTRGAFYSNFSTKDDVFYALFEEQSALMVGLVREVVQQAPAAALDVGLIATILERLRPHAREWYLIQTEFLMHAMRNADVGERFLAHRNRFEREFADVLVDALRLLGRRPTIPAEQLADVLASLYLKNLAEQAIVANHEATHGESGAVGAALAPGRGAPAGDAFIAATLPTVLLGLSEPVDA